MIILIKLFLNSKLDLIGTDKFVKQLFRIQIQKGRKVLLWNQVKSRMEACYSELVLAELIEFMMQGCATIELKNLKSNVAASPFGKAFTFYFAV